MYIQPCDNTVNMYGQSSWSKFLKSIKQKTLENLPDKVFNDNSSNLIKWNKVQKTLSSPAENRFVMGATAILTQPTIDYYNHKVDKDTREISRNRTIAKILAGTAVGIMVRGSAQKIIESMTDITSIKAYGKKLLPEKHLASILKIPAFMSNYRNTLSTLLAILAMCVTNFAIDAPLTVFLTNHLNARSKEKKLKAAEEVKK